MIDYACMRAKMAALRFSSVHLLIFLLLSLQVHFATDFQLVVKTLVVPSKYVLAEYSPVISGVVAKHRDLSNAPRRPVNGWTKDGFICLYLPLKDLTECMDIQANPDPSQTSNITNLRSSAPVSKGNSNYILPTSADRKVYTRNLNNSMSMRPCYAEFVRF